MFDSSSHWDQLHENPRFRPIYPNDHVVRFLMANRELLEKHHPARFLDIGLGAGRHTKLAAELGFRAFGVDISFVGLQHARERLLATGLQASLSQASMLALPYIDCSFAVLLSYGVFYYGTANEMRRSIAEVHRILIPGGKALVVLRTSDDYRFGKGGTTRAQYVSTHHCRDQRASQHPALPGCGRCARVLRRVCPCGL